jgi:tetratricopeptide (TPR) repeat protein
MAKISFIQATQNCLSPKRIFHMVNESLMNVVKTEEYLTAFLLVVSPSFDVLYSNASHRKAQVFRKGGSSIEKWDTNGLFLGALENVDVGESYEEKADRLGPGDRVFLFTDGLVEARNQEGEEFGEKRISHLLMETRDISLENARDRILEAWRDFLGESKLNDDVSFLLIELARVSHDAITHREKGKELFEQGDYRKAEWEFMSALKFDNSDTLTHQLLGKCYVKTGEHEKAVDHFKQYLDENPNDAYTLYLTAATQYNMKDFNRALMNARTADRIRPDNPHTLTVMARSLDKLGRTDEARDTWKRILKLEPENETAKQELRELEEREG